VRNIDSKTITDAVISYNSASTDPRLRQLLEGLVTHLHAYIRDVKPTHAEWRTAIDFLSRAGAITTDERNEFVLTSDVLGVSSLIDMLNSSSGGTESSVLGPFHILGAPDLPVGGDLIRDNPGDHVLVSGTVRRRDGAPIAGAVLEIWQTAANGLYSNQDPAQPSYNLRASMRVGHDGRYAFTTVKPEPYTIPQDGPVGDLLRATGRPPWRPSHLHVIVTAPGFRSLVTELFPSDDPHLDRDAVFGVRNSLVMTYQRRTDASLLPDDIQARDKLTAVFFEVEFDVVLIEQRAAGA
jgi:hydroxyquinol 1,2-dioxygenase